MAKSSPKKQNGNGANLGLEGAALGHADKLRGNISDPHRHFWDPGVGIQRDPRSALKRTPSSASKRTPLTVHGS